MQPHICSLYVQNIHPVRHILQQDLCRFPDTACQVTTLHQLLLYYNRRQYQNHIFRRSYKILNLFCVSQSDFSFNHFKHPFFLIKNTYFLFQKRIMTSFSSFVNFPSLLQIPPFSVIFHHFFCKIPEIRN